MAIKTESVTIPARPEHVEEREVGVICDLCGADSSAARGSGWAASHYHHDSVHVSRKSGDEYPDSYSAYYEVFDICPGCWERRVVPWLRSQGATPREFSRDY